MKAIKKLNKLAVTQNEKKKDMMKEKKQLEIETKIKSADKQIEAKSFPSQGLPARGLVDCVFGYAIALSR